jgi:lysophospholipase L1-like esterase
MNAEVLGIFDHETDPFQADRIAFDVVCAGDSLTGWGNFGPPQSWPFRCYPEFLQVLCEPLGLKVANCGVAGETSDNGVWQVCDYVKLFATARFFLICYGANDLDDSDDHEATSGRVIANLGQMVQAVRRRGKQPIILDLPDVNARLFPGDLLLAARTARSYHNARLRQFCQELDIPLAGISTCLGEEHFGDACHPNVEGAKIVARVAIRGSGGMCKAGRVTACQ